MFFLFFFNDTATTEIYTLSLHDALPIFERVSPTAISYYGAIRFDAYLPWFVAEDERAGYALPASETRPGRSEEHTSELQSRGHLVCRLLLEKKKKKDTIQSNKTKITTSQ